MDRHHVGRGQEFVEVDGADAECRRPVGVQVRVGRDHLDVEGPEPVDDEAPDGRGADDPDAQATVADRAVVDDHRRSACVPVAVPDAEHVLAHHHDGGERELGDRDGIGGGGRRDRDPAFPELVGDEPPNGAGGVGDQAQRREPVEAPGVERRAAPARHDDLGVAHLVDVRQRTRFSQVDAPPQARHRRRVEELRLEAGEHEEHRGGHRPIIPQTWPVDPAGLSRRRRPGRSAMPRGA